LGDYYYQQPRKFQYYWHCGYAHVWKRSALDAVGGLLDWAILGGADNYMCRGLCGITKQLPRSLGPVGRQWLSYWQDRAMRHLHQNVGYIDGTLIHHFHGHKGDRSYNDRGQILVNAQFDPAKDLKRDTQGLWQMEPGNVALRDGIRRYFRQRNEDAA
jgi:hypothetical protein